MSFVRYLDACAITKKTLPNSKNVVSKNVFENGNTACASRVESPPTIGNTKFSIFPVLPYYLILRHAAWAFLWATFWLLFTKGVDEGYNNNNKIIRVIARSIMDE